jgi:hypothetical protein
VSLPQSDPRKPAWERLYHATSYYQLTLEKQRAKPEDPALRTLHKEATATLLSIHEEYEKVCYSTSQREVEQP